MAFSRSIFFALAALSICPSAAGALIWPNPQTDSYEKLIYQQRGFKGGGLAEFVDGCVGFGSPEEGRVFGAEWLRTAYHDMATADVAAGTGGLDASILYEIDRGQNKGKAFSETLANLVGAVTMRTTMADLVALGAVIAVGACSNGSMVIPFRSGRVDATGAGPETVPEPQEDLASHTASFARQGFSPTEMIGLVACGHTIGGVHGVDFPEIAPFNPDKDPVDDQTASFDATIAFFENRVATEFISNTTQNPLASGPNVTTRSDERIFNADGGVEIGKMAASNDYFLSTCTDLLERMINTVPRDVVLTAPIEYYPVKPQSTEIEANDDGTMTVSGFVRIEDRLLASSNPQVLIHFAPRSGQVCSDASPCSVAVGSTDPSQTSACAYPECPARFTFYGFSTAIPFEQGVSSYTVEIIDGDTGASVIHDNGGGGFPVEEAIVPKYSVSRQWMAGSTDADGNVILKQQLNLTIAVLNAERFVNVNVVFQQRQQSGLHIITGWIPEPVELTKIGEVPNTNYTLYHTFYTYTSDGMGAHPFDLTATGPDANISSNFIGWDTFKFGDLS